MSEELVEKVRSITPSPGTDLKGLFGTVGGFSSGGLVTDDAVIRMEAGGISNEGAGTDDFYSQWADWLEAWESYRIYPGEFTDHGDRVEVGARLSGVTKHGGVTIESIGSATFRFEGEHITEIVFRIDREATP